MKETALTAIADRANLQTLNQDLVKKATQQRRKKSRKHCGEARVLSVEIRAKAHEIEEREAEEGQIKARNRALRGKIGFAKLVWKELRMWPFSVTPTHGCPRVWNKAQGRHVNSTDWCTKCYEFVSLVRIACLRTPTPVCPHYHATG